MKRETKRIFIFGLISIFLISLLSFSVSAQDYDPDCEIACTDEYNSCYDSCAEEIEVEYVDECFEGCQSGWDFCLQDCVAYIAPPIGDTGVGITGVKIHPIPMIADYILGMKKNMLKGDDLTSAEDFWLFASYALIFITIILLLHYGFKSAKIERISPWFLAITASLLISNITIYKGQTSQDVIYNFMSDLASSLGIKGPTAIAIVFAGIFILFLWLIKWRESGEGK